MLNSLPRWSAKADIYSLGMVLYEITSSKIPYEEFHNQLEVMARIISNSRPTIHPTCPFLMKRIIERCWDSESENRPTSTELVDMLSTLPGSTLYDAIESYQDVISHLDSPQITPEYPFRNNY